MEKENTYLLLDAKKTLFLTHFIVGFGPAMLILCLAYLLPLQDAHRFVNVLLLLLCLIFLLSKLVAARMTKDIALMDEAFLGYLSQLTKIALQDLRLLNEFELLQLAKPHLLAGSGSAAAGERELARVVHDLKSPFSTLRFFLRSLQSQTGNNRPLSQEVLVGVDRQMHHAERILNAFSVQGRSLQLERCDLGEVLRDVMATFSEIGANKDMHLVMEPCSLQVEMDPVKMRRVFGNLLLNAYEAMPPKGTIHLAARVRGDKVVVYIHNTSTYIPAELRRCIFELGYSFGKRGGAGMGLSICKEIVDAHAGTLACKSSRRYGTLFRVALPQS